MGFSGVSPNKLIIISSQKETVFDCDNKSMSEIEIDIDEKEYFAICDFFPDEIIPIASCWGGFSSDGNNFALADDGGVVIIRRK